MRQLPIKLAQDVLKEYDLEQVIVMARDKEGTDHFVTYGATKELCKEAGLSADRLKKLFMWGVETFSRYVRANVFIPTHKHKKRGTEYCEIGVGEIQSDTPLNEGDMLVVYQGVDGKLWLRPPSEFYDGRFEPLDNDE